MTTIILNKGNLTMITKRAILFVISLLAIGGQIGTATARGLCDSFCVELKIISTVKVIHKYHVKRLVRASKGRCYLMMGSVIILKGRNKKKDAPIGSMPIFDIDSNRPAIRKIARLVKRMCKPSDSNRNRKAVARKHPHTVPR